MHIFAPRVRPSQSGNRRVVTLTQHHQTKHRRCLEVWAVPTLIQAWSWAFMSSWAVKDGLFRNQAWTPGQPISFLFWPCHSACGILVPWPGIEPRPSEVSVWHRPNSWITREFPWLPYFKHEIEHLPHITSMHHTTLKFFKGSAKTPYYNTQHTWDTKGNSN